MRVFDRILKEAGIPRIDTLGRKLDLHALRHTALTRMARAGVDLMKLRAIAGHSDPKTTAQIYTHLEVEDLRDAVDATPALNHDKGRARRAGGQ